MAAIEYRMFFNDESKHKRADRLVDRILVLLHMRQHRRLVLETHKQVRLDIFPQLLLLLLLLLSLLLLTLLDLDLGLLLLL